MAKQTINIGSGELAGDGESLRSAFNKTNSNFNELYATAITATGISSNLIPSTNNTFDLGSSSTQWRSLYVSTSTIYLGGTPLTIVDGNLTVGGNPANLGNFKISGSILGTKNNPDTGGWGGYDITIDPDGFNGSLANIFIPGLASQANGTSLIISNAGDPSSVTLIRGRGSVQISTNQGATEKVFAFYDDGKLELPPGGDIVNSTGVSVLGGGGAGSFTFTNVSFSTPSIAFNTTSSQGISGPQAYILNKITVSTSSWVRVYVSTSTQQNDLFRSIDVDPVSTTGIVAEAITTQSGTIVFSPGINGFNNESTPISQIPISVTYLGTGSAIVNVTLHLIRLIP